ncbi:MAG: hypothetical protein RBR93_07620 [Aliarcobacter butzleri]|nr:hypothetical protein [Aliarcobacter butzleri]
MNKAVLKQAIKFKNNLQTNKNIEVLINAVKVYQKVNEIFFLNYAYNQKPEITNKDEFFKFLSEINNLEINSFEDIEYLLSTSSNRKESIEKTSNSKEYYTKVFDKTVVYQFLNNSPCLYKDINSIPVDYNKRILVVENGESFLNIYNTLSKYGFEQYLYLSGFPNSLTKEFIKDKNIVCFLDYDIEAIRIYNSLICKNKEFFKHPNIELYFNNKSYLNKDLYKKQRANLPERHNELQWLINLIKTHSGVIEQEILIET